ncbi:MAG: formyl transferase [Deltaproteobacteria bacterium]|nr:formyl transferase [Deltaproteobacteria bacterium]MBW2063818.1 formyl transferase [Deltaproteobacteria bacterium]
MTIKPIFDPEKMGRAMRVAAFMSGSGTNIIKLIEHERRLKKEKGASPYQVIFIFSDRSDGSCQGESIACENAIPYFSYDIRSFHHVRGLARTIKTPEGLAARKEFDSVASRLVEAFEIDVNALGGYMSYTTLDRCINVHPADLCILDEAGKRKYVGDNAVLDAIAGGEPYLRSSTLWTDKGIDTGPVLMVSRPIKVDLPEPLEFLLKNRDSLVKVAEEHQGRLKEEGDWKVFPLTMELIARGRFGLDEENRVYFDGKPVPDGFRYD